MTVADEVQSACHLFEDCDTETPLGFGDILDRLKRQGFTGAVTFHFRHGRPQLMELGPPVRLKVGRVDRIA